MMVRSKPLHATPDGQISGLQVIAYHGQVEPDQTPARRGPVHVDRQQRIVEIAEVRRVQAKAGSQRSGFAVSVEVASSSLVDGALPGIGTPIGPWPAKLEHYVVLLGPEERRCLASPGKVPGTGGPERLRSFLQWIQGEAAPPGDLTCERRGDLVAWYCSPEEAFALWKCIQPAAREALVAAVRGRNAEEIRRISFWLSRAAVTDADIYLAVAGLQRVSYPHWKVVLDAGVRDGTEEQRAAGLEEAERQLSREVPSQTGMASTIRERARRAVDCSFEILPRANAA
jgi:hypothetical protein